MKKFLSITALALSFLLVSCEEVVDVDLDTAAPRLVVDASIDWVKGTDGALQTVRLTTTAGYFDDAVPTVSGAVVFITSGDGSVFTFSEIPGSGNYQCSDFAPGIGQTYTLSVQYEDKTFTATETLMPVPTIDSFEQDDEGGFFGDQIEVRFFFQDDAAATNYYLMRVDSDVMPYPEFTAYDDEFVNGNQAFGSFSHDDLEAGDVLGIQLIGISRRYYEYMEKLLLISGNSGGGPFATAPATVRGNVVNASDNKDFAFGYFRVCEVDARTYNVQ